MQRAAWNVGLRFSRLAPANQAITTAAATAITNADRSCWRLRLRWKRGVTRFLTRTRRRRGGALVFDPGVGVVVSHRSSPERFVAARDCYRAMSNRQSFARRAAAPAPSVTLRAPARESRHEPCRVACHRSHPHRAGPLAHARRPEWANPGGGLWGGYAIGLAIRVLEAEPEAVGEALSLTLTYIAATPAGPLDIRTRRIRQGGSVGVWSGTAGGGLGPGRRACHRHVGAPAGDAAVRLRKMPTRPIRRAFPPRRRPARRCVTTARPASSGARSTVSRRLLGPTPARWPGRAHAAGRSTRALLGMITDNSAPRAMYALGPDHPHHHADADGLHARHRRGTGRHRRRLHPGSSARAGWAAAARRTSAPATGAGRASCWPPANS